MRRSATVVLTTVVMLGLLLPACQGSPNGTLSATEQPRIAVAMSGSVDDASWNAAAYHALQALTLEGIAVTYAEDVSVADAPQMLREYAEQGIPLVIGHSSHFEQALLGAASAHAGVSFAWPGGKDSMVANIADYDAPFYEAAYPIGIIAGHMNKTGWVGAVYGLEVPQCYAMAQAFWQGARSVDPDIGLSAIVVGDWDDADRARDAMVSWDSSADFWITCGRGPVLGAIEFVRERGGHVTGYLTDMSEHAPDVVLLSLVWNLEPLYQRMLDDIEAGSFGEEFYGTGLADGVLQVVYNNALEGQIPPEAIAAAEQALVDIRSGALVVPYEPGK